MTRQHEVLMELLFLWLIFSLITIMLAPLKGRNFFLWLILGVLLGPIALLYLTRLPDKKTGPDN